MKWVKAVAVIIILPIIFTSCTSTQTLKQLSIAEGLGVDEKSSGVSVIVQTLNLAKNGSSESLSGNITMTSSVNGNSISDAVSKLSKAVSKKLFFGQNKLVVFGNSLARRGLGKNLDYLVRSTDSRPDVALCVSEQSAAGILKSKENDTLVPAENIARLLKNGERSGMGAYVTVNDVLQLFCDKTSDIYLPVVESKGNSVRVKGIGLFDDDRLTVVTNDEETLGLLLLMGRIRDGLITVNNKELGNIGVEIMSCKTKSSAEYIDGRVRFSVKIKCKLMIDEVEKGLVNHLDNKDIKIIENNVENRMSELCSKAYLRVLESSGDCLRVGEYLSKSDSAAYDELSDNWIAELKRSELDIRVICNITKVNDDSIRE